MWVRASCRVDSKNQNHAGSASGGGVFPAFSLEVVPWPAWPVGFCYVAYFSVFFFLAGLLGHASVILGLGIQLNILLMRVDIYFLMFDKLDSSHDNAVVSRGRGGGAGGVEVKGGGEEEGGSSGERRRGAGRQAEEGERERERRDLAPRDPKNFSILSNPIARHLQAPFFCAINNLQASFFCAINHLQGKSEEKNTRKAEELTEILSLPPGTDGNPYPSLCPGKRNRQFIGIGRGDRS